MFKGASQRQEAERLLDRVVAAGRNPALFGEGRAQDTLEGRFEVLTVFASLALYKMREDRALAQAFTDRLFGALDAGLREAGTGDTAVSKRMHELAGAFYGRLQAYSAALDAGDAGQFSEALERNVPGVGPAWAKAWTDELLAASRRASSGVVTDLFK